MNFTDKTSFIWSVADLLRGDFKQSEYGKVILPFTVLRRFDCVLSISDTPCLSVLVEKPIFYLAFEGGILLINFRIRNTCFLPTSRLS